MAVDRHALLAEMAGEVKLGGTFLALAASSSAIATFGLLANSVAVIIGAMLIAPLMTPTVAAALAIIGGDFKLFRSALFEVAVASVLAIAFSALIAAAVHLPVPGSEILARGQPNLLDLGVALAAGAIAGFARIRKNIATTVAGAAIAVALMPPLCVAGIGISLRNGELAYGALLLFVTNFVGIVVACALVFAASGLASRYARGGIFGTLALLALIAIPLALATARLEEQQRLEATLRAGLLNDTQTFKRVQLVSTTIDWLQSPVRVELVVRAQEPITPTQVGFLQSFAEQRIRRKLQLVVDVSPISTVRAPAAP